MADGRLVVLAAGALAVYVRLPPNATVRHAGRNALITVASHDTPRVAEMAIWRRAGRRRASDGAHVRCVFCEVDAPVDSE